MATKKPAVPQSSSHKCPNCSCKVQFSPSTNLCGHCRLGRPCHALPQSSPLPISIHKTPAHVNFKILVDVNGKQFGTAQDDEKSALIVRRVNQGPAFDAMVEALHELIHTHPSTGNNDTWTRIQESAITKARAALKLAQEVK